ncbi:MAG: CHAP domain-containing protein, partial [Pedobacter sp.]
VKLPIGEPWCAAFISWVFKQHGFLEPNTGWSPAMFPNTRILSNAVKNATKANVFGIYIIAKKRIAHVGFVEDQHRGWVTTIEGNTNSAGSNEGDGVYRKLRHIRTIRSFADWVKKGRLK